MTKNQKINFLVVDDEKPIQKIVTDMLTIYPDSAAIYTAGDGDEAFEVYEEQDIDIVITDILMPQVTGIDLIRKLKGVNPEAHIIVISAFSDINLIRQAIRLGAYDYLIKPFTIDDFMICINRISERIRFLEERKKYQQQLEQRVDKAEGENAKGRTLILKRLIEIIDSKDFYTLSDAERTVEWVRKITEKMRIDKEEMKNLVEGSYFHDIGKIGISETLLTKTTPLVNEEWTQVRMHTEIGRKLVESAVPGDECLTGLVYSHHEWYSGDGYPQGLKGENIPICARIVGVADALTAMTSDRPFRKSLPMDAAREEIKKGIGIQFDPDIARIVIDMI